MSEILYPTKFVIEPFYFEYDMEEMYGRYERSIISLAIRGDKY